MAENVDRMVWMGAGRPPGPGSWEASELARETNRVPLLLNCLSVLYPPAITNTSSYKYYQSNCSDPRPITSWNLRPENSGSCPSSIPWQRAWPCITPFEEISAFGFLVGKLPRNPGAAHGSRWLNSLVGMFTRSVRLSSSPRGVKAKGDKNAACRKWLQPLSPPLKAHQESITAASAPPERL